MAREYVCLYHSYLKSVEPLNDTECGRLFRACLTYSMTGAEPDLRGNERFVWPMIQQQIDRDTQKYEEFCAKQRSNINKRWADTTVYGGRSGIPDDTKNTKEKEKAKTKTKANINPPLSPLQGEVERFVEFRRKSKKPLTDHAVELLMQNLEKLAPGDDGAKIRILQQSIVNGWTGVYPLKEEDNGRDTQPVHDWHVRGIEL